MKVTFSSPGAANSGAALVISASGEGHAYDSAALSAAAKAADFHGKKGDGFETYAVTGGGTVKLFMRGRGDQDHFDYEMATARVAKSLRGTGETELTVHLDGTDATPVDAARAALGARLAAYVWEKHKSKATKAKKPHLGSITIVSDDAEASQAAYDNYFGPVGDGVVFARDLVNAPPNEIYPKAYADRIETLSEFGIEVEVLGEKKMEKLGMHSLLGVGLGSERESQLVIMKYMGGEKGEAPTALVGKGVTFDTGGISLKPGANMWDMKGDMGGSAAVVGAMIGLAKRKAKANVVGLVGLVENMPDGKAQLPGDIVVSMSGQTIEVQNTDAEGRLVLADALHYAQEEYKPKAMVNLATLTGAIIVSLGHEYAGVFSRNDEIAKELVAAGETSTDLTWRLPMADAYDKMLNSPNADMKNIGGRAAGSITAAQFLGRFVKKDLPWAHIDIAGTGMKNGSKDPREPTFGTGFGVRLLNRWIADNYEG
ncbi:leucyl aminopeptidase [Litorimonas sp. WD9-15]|uniref:leucyl aminopeptidase n=1 Tax=Litorimonas sp. WD9-15 TaxID=3418716 RepID=UPI003D05B372